MKHYFLKSLSIEILFLLLQLIVRIQVVLSQNGILFPQDSETRECKTLDGIWHFRIAPRNDPDLGFRKEWYNRSLQEIGDVDLMPVPSSYNDVTQSKTIRDHVGWVWYDREFRIPKDWFTNKQIWLRFGSVNYHAIVWVNGIKVMEHSGGHLPFQGEIDPSILSVQSSNRVTVAVNNTLSSSTIPQGKVVYQTSSRYPKGYFTLDYNFDFFNYAGIHRPVYIYTTPVIRIDDITVTTSVQGTTGVVSYNVDAILFVHHKNKFEHKNSVSPNEKTQPSYQISVRLEDKFGTAVAWQTGFSNQLTVNNAKLWWPFTMVEKDEDAGYLYTLVVMLKDLQDNVIDFYRLKIGIRTIKWDRRTFYINNKPFYFRGFGRHEDFNIRGKGIDPVMIVKDHNLIKWMGANSYRTSHYPYSEEIMDLTDELGIIIIDEISAVSIDGFGPELLATHKRQMTELIKRDKNRPSVVMWSISNEPQSQKTEAGPYFRKLVNLTKSLDNSRPVTIVLNKQCEIVDLTRSLDVTRPITIVVAQDYSRDQAARYVDIICINRYFAWYSDVGHLEVITNSMIQDVNNWVNKFNRPIIVSEYGADTIAGMHMSPEFVFTEEFQLEYMKEHFKAFDILRNSTSLIGEMIWNFADFMTGQGITRIVGNRKGVFTRERQPKASAHLLRTRYHLLADEANKYPLPADLQHLLPVYGRQKSRIEL